MSTNFMFWILLCYLKCVRCIITFNILINQHVIMCVSIGFNKGILSASKITKGNRKILFHRKRCLSIHSNGFLLFANDCFYTDTTDILTKRCLNLTEVHGFADKTFYKPFCQILFELLKWQFFKLLPKCNYHRWSNQIGKYDCSNY